jgi:predicted XRE-type DNA-binding protein
MTTKVGKKQIKVTRSSGNIFADLALPNPDEELLKAHLVIAIRDAIEARGLSQAAAGKKMRLAQPDVSKLIRGRVSGFSIDRILACLRALGSDVEIKVKPAKNEERIGRLSLVVV